MTRLAWLAMVASAASACTTSAPYVDIAEPKVYTEDDSLRFLSERRRELDKLATTISAAELQEVHGIRERSATQLSLALGRKSGEAVEPDDPPQLSQALPDTPTSSIGLAYSELLQRQVTRAQEFAAYDLLYLGDHLIQNQTHRVYMVRLDVSVNAFLDCGATPQFVVVELEVEADTGQARIYALMPEFSAATAKETWIASVLRDYSGSLAYPIGSFDASAGGRQQSELEQSFERLVQQPLQFAIYQSEPGKCAFAIGPRRRVEKRSWTNPARWFGSTYRIDYEITPGPRACMALVSVPHIDGPITLTMRRSIVTTSGAREIDSHANRRPEAKLFTNEALHELRTLTANGEARDVTGRPTPRPPVARSDAGTERHATTMASGIEPTAMASAPPTPTVITLPPRVADPEPRLALTPKTGGSLLVSTTLPISSATRAFLADVAVPLANTVVLGARRLQLDIAKSDTLEAHRSTAKAMGVDPVIELRLVTPGSPLDVFRVNLLEGPSTPPITEPKPLWAASPGSGAGPLQVRLQPTDVSNASFAAAVRKVEALLATGRAEVPFTFDPSTHAISVALPAATHNKRAFVDFWITREVAGRTVVDIVPKAFRYDF
jgi:hypothetical protein